MRSRLTLMGIAIVAALTFAGARALLAGDGGTPVPASSSVRASSAVDVSRLEASVRAHPADTDPLVKLATAYLGRARQTGDSSFYGLSETAVKRALDIEPDNVPALVSAGTLANARHDFAAALMLGEKARALEPSYIATYGVITDANVELGRYDEAIASAQAMADLRPDLAALSRISYIRELQGDTDGAIEAMTAAGAAGSTVPQDVVWARVLLGNLYLAKGDIDGAARAYDEATRQLSDDPQARFGQARLAIARGDLPRAETDLRFAIERRPQPDYLITLGDLLWSQGRTKDADQQYATVQAINQLFVANGGDADIELALFNADHDIDPPATYEKARAAYERRPSVTAADTVAWAAYKAGRIDDAQAYVALAKRLGTRDPRLAYHAGVIADAAGDRPSAERYLREADAMSPAQSLRYAADARNVLARLTATASR